jgi:ABC-type hemin transport system ATPase subunit
LSNNPIGSIPENFYNLEQQTSINIEGIKWESREAFNEFIQATSALDSITEQEITSTIRNISNSRDHITVMIAHRLSTVMHADRIYVLEKGELAETGNHTQLLAEKGLYYAMWRQQIGERKSEPLNVV